MEIVPLAFDSMGARGMSFLVKTQEAKILVDPGVNLAPERHKLPPHPLEEYAKKEMWKRIELWSLEREQNLCPLRSLGEKRRIFLRLEEQSFSRNIPVL